KARYGGDEYIIAMPETDEKGARLAAERLRANIEQAVHEGNEGTKFSVTASMGLATFDAQRHQTYKDLIKDADCALYAAKRQGRNRAVFYVHGETERPDEDKLKRT
ncbi:MAG: GGDEF domain-containing protein, partial [Bdellovibrionales bacterium]|nr:GGDEF domain-containing protein [Bdellovibrionales bacterium]